MLRLRLKNNKNIIIIWSLITLFFVIPISKIINFEGLFAIDPRMHMSLTKNLEPEKLFGYKLQFYDGEENVHYPTFMRTYLYEYHLITNIEHIEIFKYFGFVTRFFLFIIILIFIKTIYALYFKKKLKNSEEILFVILALGHSYFRTRSWITFPENFALVFHGLILLLCTKFLIKNQNVYLFLIALFCGISIYYHNPSFVIVFLIVFGFFTALFFQNKKTCLKNILYVLVPFTVLSLPVIGILLSEYIRQFTHNIGSNIQAYGDITRFVAPSILTYIWFASSTIIIFGILGSLKIFKKVQPGGYINKKGIILPLLFLVIGTFILTNGTRFNINVPTDRMQGYFIIPIIILAYIGIISFIRNKSIFVKILIFFVIFVSSINNVIISKSWIKSGKLESEIGNYLSQNYTQDKKYFFDKKINYHELQFPYFKNIVREYSNLNKGDYIITHYSCPVDSNIAYKEGDISICILTK